MPSRLEPTYEGLKPRLPELESAAQARLEPTYEGLKHLWVPACVHGFNRFGAYL